MPFDCPHEPAVIKNNGNSNRIIIAQYHNYGVLNIYANYHEPSIERIIWIGFYKNDKNDQCLIKTLPKDLILFILLLLGKNQPLVKPYIKVTI